MSEIDPNGPGWVEGSPEQTLTPTYSQQLRRVKSQIFPEHPSRVWDREDVVGEEPEWAQAERGGAHD